MASGKHVTYIAGINMVDVRAARRPERWLTVLNADGVDLGVPSGRFTFGFPRALVDGRDRLRLLWAEPDVVDTSVSAMEWFHQRPTTLWAAMLSPDSGWSQPEVILRDAGLRWGFGYPIGGGSTTDGVVHFALTLRDGAAGRLVHLSRRNGVWNVGEIPSRRGGAYVGLAADGHHLAVGYVSTAPGSRSDHNSVFLSRSMDGGVSWTPGELVSRSGETPAYDLLTLVAGDDTEHLIWKQLRSSGLPVLRHVSRAPSDDAWSVPSDLELPADAHNFRAITGPCNTVHVVFEHRINDSESHLDYVAWQNGWGKVDHVVRDAFQMDAMFSSTPSPDATLVFSDLNAEGRTLRVLLRQLRSKQ
jgi:hypothetical protein